MSWTTYRMCGIAAFAASLGMSGCASPGPPLPPTLNLPQVVSGSGLTAMRVGDQVRLHWTTPTQTTDKLPIKGPIAAEVCREMVAGNAANATNPIKGVGTKPCKAVTRVEVTAGASDAADRLPATLTAGPARMLLYRVQLLNAAGRTAGPSQAVFAAAGEAPGPIAGFAGNVTKAGVLLRWTAEAQATAGTGTVELDRLTLEVAAGSAKGPDSERRGGLPGAQRQATEARLRAGAGGGDSGGTIDRTAEIGHSYSYTAQRVDLVNVGGQSLELRSVATAALSFTVRDEFPPSVPVGLVAVPGIDGGVEGKAQAPTIDLSWEPDVEPGVAGYRVYRREVGDGSGKWRPLSPGQVTEPAYRDLGVVAGRRYAYRVTSMSTAGNESAPSREVVETAAGQ